MYKYHDAFFEMYILLSQLNLRPLLLNLPKYELDFIDHRWSI